MLGRAGVSAGIADGLGRALAQLRLVGGGGVEAEVQALLAASRELEMCLGLVRAADGADRQLEEDVAKLHRRIGRLVRPAEGAPAAPVRPPQDPWSGLAGGTTALPSLPPPPQVVRTP